MILAISLPAIPSTNFLPSLPPSVPHSLITTKDFKDESLFLQNGQTGLPRKFKILLKHRVEVIPDWLGLQDSLLELKGDIRVHGLVLSSRREVEGLLEVD